MKLSDELKYARTRIELAINEENRRADARVQGAGRSYGLEARLAAQQQIPRTGDGQKGR